MNSHEQFEDLLAIRKDLSAAEAEHLASHLQSCEWCRYIAAAYAKQDSLLAALRDDMESPAVATRGLAVLSLFEDEQSTQNLFLTHSEQDGASAGVQPNVEQEVSPTPTTSAPSCGDPP